MFWACKQFCDDWLTTYIFQRNIKNNVLFKLQEMTPLSVVIEWTKVQTINSSNGSSSNTDDNV